MHTALSPSRHLAVANGHARWTIDPEDVLKGIAAFDEDDREALLWLDQYGRSNNLTTSQLGAMLIKPNGNSYSKDTVYQVLTGREKSISIFVGAVQTLRARPPSISAPYEFPFVESAVADSVWNYIELTRKWHKIGLLIGESQTGKTRSILEYAKANPELDFLYLQLTTGAHKSKVVEEMCEARGVSDKYNCIKQEKRLARTITPQTLIVLDEVQQCASRKRAGGRMTAERVDTIEYFRRLHDTRHCPLLLVGTSEALDMLEGKKFEYQNGNIFVQTMKRALDPYVLKNRPPARDLNAFAHHLDLKPAQDKALELQNDTVVKRGLEIWLTYLLAGAELASLENRAVTWSDVLTAHKTFQSGEGK